MRAIEKFLVSEEGPTAVEYAVMLALIVVVCLVGILALGQNASSSLQNSSDLMEAAGMGGS